ncbi:G-protein coupled receptor family C group 6 member A [Lampris incognitus]|uniref:G-protein coupled receptor family C group 6 member A n=1 Tax=Lampris incognitus TaxID=2546036 RepID=UPI0024B549C4|nr:G-protein coupled receptor family C group 6 member A [Lampris incognitus]
MQISLLCCGLLGLVASTASTPAASGCGSAEPTCGARFQGDVMIGLLMPCHSKIENLHHRLRPEMFPCTDFDLVAFMRSLAVIHMIEEINASGFLPGLSLGYVMCDTCADATMALQNVEYMLAVNNSRQVMCDYTDFRPAVKAVLGARYSEVSIAVARLLSIFMIPQLSSTSSSPSLSDILRFPSFMRTVPSDTHQTKALTKLMAHFNWDWVGVVYGDDDYGKAAFRSFLRDAEEIGVCLAYQEMIPHYLDHKTSIRRIRQVVRQISSSNAQVVLLILKSELVGAIFKEMIREGTSRTWIASDIWSLSGPLAHMEGISQVGDIFGFSFVTRKSEAFDDYLKNLRPTPGGYNHFIEKYKNLRFNCTPECGTDDPPSYCPTSDLLNIKSPHACDYTNAQDGNDDFLTTAVDSSGSHNERMAVSAVAHALKELLRCNDSSCPGEINFPPWKLLEILKNISFNFENQTYSFNEYGDFVSGYDLIFWEKNGDHRSFEKLGSYNASNGQIQLDMNKINWSSTFNDSIPKSKCSESCGPGTVKKFSEVSCCYNCTPCMPGTFSDAWDLLDCESCSNGTWSLGNSSYCEPVREVYLRWSEPYPIALVASAGFGMLLLLVIFIIFLVYRESPPMKRAEVRLSCVMMFGIAVSFGSVICFIGYPNVHLCRARQVMYAMGFTLCISCVLVKAFRTFLAFLPFSQQIYRGLNKLYKPPIIVSVVTLLQGVICTLWLIFDSPCINEDTHSRRSLEIIIQCNVGLTFIGFGIMLSYIALLALVGFVLAFKGRKVPQQFSETGYIIFSMLMYLFVWVCFIPVYILKTGQEAYVQASAILVSSYGIIFCHFLPKCYEALWELKGDTLEIILKKWHVTNNRTLDENPQSHSSYNTPCQGVVSHETHPTQFQSSLTSSESSGVLSLGSPTGSEVVILAESKSIFSDQPLKMLWTKQMVRRRFRSISF